jgi:hypothetical protein
MGAFEHLLEAGPAARAAESAVGKMEEGGARLIKRKLFHGSAHEFTAYDFSRADTQALFGPGVYLTENPVIAHTYASMHRDPGAIGGISPVTSEKIKAGKFTPNIRAHTVAVRNPFDLDARPSEALHSAVDKLNNSQLKEQARRRLKARTEEYMARADATHGRARAEVERTRHSTMEWLIESRKSEHARIYGGWPEGTPVPRERQEALQDLRDLPRLRKHWLEETAPDRQLLAEGKRSGHYGPAADFQTGEELYNHVASALGGKAHANQWLQEQGHDALTHIGGGRMPLRESHASYLKSLGSDERHRVWVLFQQEQLQSQEIIRVPPELKEAATTLQQRLGLSASELAPTPSHLSPETFATFPGGNFHTEEEAPPAAPSPVVFDRGHVEAATQHMTEETALAGDPHVTTRVSLHDAPLDMQQVDKMYTSRVKFGTPL